MRGLNGKRAIVTGGSHGIGAATCRRLAEEGVKVGVTDITAEDGERIASEIRDAGGEADFLELDVSDEHQVTAVLDRFAESWGGIDAVVNNAGISGADRPTHELSLEEWHEVMRINVDGVFLMTKHTVPHLRRSGGGSIVNLSSIYGIVGAPDIPPYHASKGAIREMTKVDALLYAKDGIRVNSVHPGFIWTPLVEDLARRSPQGAEKFRAGLDELHPIGHVGTPEDVAAGIAFLLSDDARFMTGSELVIDGGYICR